MEQHARCGGGQVEGYQALVNGKWMHGRGLLGVVSRSKDRYVQGLSIVFPSNGSPFSSRNILCRVASSAIRSCCYGREIGRFGHGFGNGWCREGQRHGEWLVDASK